MPEAAANAFIESVKLLLSPALTGSCPRVVYTDSHFEPTLDLLPAEWPREPADPSAFASAVSHGLTETSIVAFPPWGTPKGSREPREVSAVQEVFPGPAGRLLVLVLPFGTLVSQAAKPLRVRLGNAWRIRAVVSGSGGLKGVAPQFQHSLVLLETLDAEAGVLRMFDATNARASEASNVIGDLQRLMRMSGGSTEFGYVLREMPPSGAPLISRLYDPRLVQRRRELADFGRVAHLDHLFEVLGDPRLPDLRRADAVEADTVGSARVITGRDILRSNEIAPADDNSRWVLDRYPALIEGDIVVRAIHAANAVQPGLVWARVTAEDLPLAAGPHVLILRPRPHADPDDIEFVLRFISSGTALELAEDFRLPPAVSHISADALSALRIPVPDAALKDALASIEQARRRAAAWSGEADDILDKLFDYDSATEARLRVLERSRLVRLRMKAVDDIETLDGQVRTQYPLPIAYRWRALEAARSHGNTRDAYVAALDSAEQTIAFMANVGLALAREVGSTVSTVADIGRRLTRGQGTSMSDWCNILDELAGRSFTEIDAVISTPEFRNFCSNPAVKAARQDLLRRRNDEAHGRRVELIDLDDAVGNAMASLETINRSLAFLLDNPLVIARSLRWDTIHNHGVLDYQVLSGDHSVVPVHQMPVPSPNIEADSLYLLDSKRSLHLLRPFLTGTNCQRCGTFSVFYVDQRRNRGLTIKSLEHGHSIEAPESLVQAVTAVGLDIQG